MSSPARPDIAGRPDIELLVSRFYEKVRADELLGPIFDGVAKVDWSSHIPRLCDFWERVILGTGNFRGNPLGVHANLALLTDMDWPRFRRWLDLFEATVDELFEGERASHIKNAADDMAHVIYSRINKVPDPRFANWPKQG
jgi:hemoglobin